MSTHSLPLRFPPDVYARYRPEYPRELFHLMEEWSESAGLHPPFVVAEIGCGSGQASVGLLDSGLVSKLTAVEPDQEMLMRAQERIDKLNHESVDVSFVEAGGEATGLPSCSQDMVVCTSAFHWMDRRKAAEEFLRLLKRPGLVFLAEYGFPVSHEHPRFNSWVQEKLKGEWEIPELRNRGSFQEIIGVFREFQAVRDLGVKPVPMIQELDWLKIAGLIKSQSRYVRAREALSTDEERLGLERKVDLEVHELLGEGSDRFDFRLQAAGFVVGET